MPNRTKWLAGGLVLAGVVAPGVVLGPRVEDRVRDRMEVGRDLRLNQAHLSPAERGEVADRLRAAADKPWLSPAERARRLDAAGLACFWAGRAADAKPLFRAEYDLIRDTAGPDELVWLLNKINNCLLNPRTAAELDELRANHAAIRALGPRVRGTSETGVVRASPAVLAEGIERYARHVTGQLPAAEEWALLDEAIRLREDAVGPWQQSTDADGLFRLAEVVALRGDQEKAAALFERVAGFAGPGGWPASAFERVLKLRHPDRADPRRAAAIETWVAGRPNNDHEALTQELGFCYLELKKYREAAVLFRGMADRDSAKPAPDPLAVSYHLGMLAKSLDGAGQKAEADAVRQRLVAEFPDTPLGREAARFTSSPP